MGLLPTPEPPDPVEGALGHFEHSNWVKQGLKNLDAALTPLVGGSQSGHLTIDPSNSEDARAQLQGSGARAVRGQSRTGVARWDLVVGDATAENGSNSGSRFALLAYGDTGSLLHTVLTGDRSSGLLTVAGSPITAKGIATKEYVDQQLPIGAIIAYGGAAAPAGWHLCDGSAHGSTALQAVLGSANTPDLRARFIVGVGSGYTKGQTGGAATVTLTAAQSGIPAHGHTATAAAELQNHTHNISELSATANAEATAHSHSVAASSGLKTGNDDVDHTHSTTGQSLTTSTVTPAINMSFVSGKESGNEIAGGDLNYLTDGTGLGTGGQALYGTQAAHNHTVSLPALTTGGRSAFHQHPFTVPSHNTDPNTTKHTHSVTVPAHSTLVESASHDHAISVNSNAAANASAAHENLPPYYALTYIIKKS